MKRKGLIVVGLLVALLAFFAFAACKKDDAKPAIKLTGISVAQAPNKTVYVEGDLFDTDGMVINANYSDGSSYAVTGYIWTDRKLVASDTSIEITYQGKKTNQAITVSEAPVSLTFTAENVSIVLKSSGTLTATAGAYSKSGTWGNSGTKVIIELDGKTYTVDKAADGDSYTFDFTYNGTTVQVSAPSASNMTTTAVFTGNAIINGTVMNPAATATLNADGTVSFVFHQMVKGDGTWYKSGAVIEITTPTGKLIPVYFGGKYYLEHSLPMSIYVMLGQLYYTPA
jgi:hypothetical protein